MANEQQEPIRDRFDRLFNQWNAFATDPDARLLRWLADEDEEGMLDAFFDMQNEAASDSPDLFVVLAPACDDTRSYTAALIEALASQVERSRADLAASGSALTWQAPPPRPAPGEPEPKEFCDACLALAAELGSLMERLAIVLRPQRIANPSHWQAWLQRLMETGVPQPLRFVLVERTAAPLLAALAAANPGAVATVPADLQMPEAIAQLARRGDPKDPGVRFRRCFVDLSNVLASGPQCAVDAKSREALAIARRQGWPDQQYVIHAMLAARFLMGGQVDGAIGCYRDAGQAAGQAVAAGHPAGPKLALQAQLGEAGALVSGGRFAPAAQIYRRAVPTAMAAGDGLMELECWRMASFCREQAQERDDAWRCALDGLSAAERLPPEQRATTTLPYLGQGLLRLLADPQREPERAGVEARLAAALGADWREIVAAAGSAS